MNGGGDGDLVVDVDDPICVEGYDVDVDVDITIVA